MHDILDSVAAVIEPHAGFPIFLGLTTSAPDDAVIISQYNAAPPFLTFGGVHYIYGVKVDARSKDVKAAREAMGRIEAALERNHHNEYAITPASAVMYAGQDEKQRHLYTASYKVSEM